MGVMVLIINIATLRSSVRFRIPRKHKARIQGGNAHVHRIVRRPVNRQVKPTEDFYKPLDGNISWSDNYICGFLNFGSQYDVILFTTMYYEESVITDFMNEIDVTASLAKFSKEKLRPILFADESLIEYNDSNLVNQICEMGWLVFKVPHYNEYGFPVFKTMFRFIQQYWVSDWYGYFNGDILFDNSLLDTLSFLYNARDIYDRPISLVTGHRFLTPVRCLSTFDVMPIN